MGFAGLSGGAGAFLTRDLALMFRLSGTTVSYDFGVSALASRSSTGANTICNSAFNTVLPSQTRAPFTTSDLRSAINSYE